MFQMFTIQHEEKCPLSRGAVQASCAYIKQCMLLPMTETSIKALRLAMKLHHILPQYLASPRSFQGITTRAVDKPLRGEWVHPPACDDPTTNVILFLHGGGFLVLEPTLYRTITVQMAKRCNAKVFVPDYRLSPEYKYPCALDDCEAAYEYVLSTGAKPSDVTFMGDSAGGNLVSALIIRLIQKGSVDKLPRNAVVMSPWLDLSGKLCPSRDANAETDILLPRVRMETVAAHYCDSTQYEIPEVSPLYASDEVMEQFPPMLFHVGTTEMLLDDSRLMCGHLVRNGVLAFIQLFSDEPHVFQIYGEYYAPALRSIKDMAHFVRYGGVSSM